MALGMGWGKDYSLLQAKIKIWVGCIPAVAGGLFCLQVCHGLCSTNSPGVCGHSVFLSVCHVLPHMRTFVVVFILYRGHLILPPLDA